MPEDATLFFYLGTTLYESNKEQGKVVTVDGLSREYIITDDESEKEEVAKTEFKRVYYVSQENAQALKDGHWFLREAEADDITENQEQLEELKKESVLIWEEK